MSGPALDRPAASGSAGTGSASDRPAATGSAVAGVVVTAACTACGACLATCPERALRPVRGRLHVLDHCSGCLECVEICPADAITEIRHVVPLEFA